MAMAEKFCFVLIGTVGCGKSALATTLIGQDVFAPPEQLTFPPSNEQVGNLALKWGEGNFLGNPQLGPVRIGDFPGFNDKRGKEQDINTMAEIGRVLESETVHGIIFVCEAENPRMSSAVAEMFDAVLYKLDPSDYNKIHFVVNKASLNPDMLLKRKKNVESVLKRPATEGDVMRHVVTLYLNFFRERIDGGKLPPMDDAVLDGFGKAFNFVDTNYISEASYGPEEKKRIENVVLKLKSTSRPINKEKAAENQTRHVHQDYKNAKEAADKHKQELEQQMKHSEELRTKADDLKKAGDENAQAAQKKFEEFEGQVDDFRKRAEASQQALDEQRRKHEEEMMERNKQESGGGIRGPVGGFLKFLSDGANALGL